jgi:hypothetical protein
MIKTFSLLSTASLSTVLATALLLCAPSLRAQDKPLPEEVGRLQKCAASVVLTRCDSANSGIVPAGNVEPAASDTELGRVVVIAPFQKKNTPSDVLNNLFGNFNDDSERTKVGPVTFPHAQSGSVRNDRDSFGNRTECQERAVGCANQPGRPQTTRVGDGS